MKTLIKTGLAIALLAGAAQASQSESAFYEAVARVNSKDAIQQAIRQMMPNVLRIHKVPGSTSHTAHGYDKQGNPAVVYCWVIEKEA